MVQSRNRFIIKWFIPMLPTKILGWTEIQITSEWYRLYRSETFFLSFFLLRRQNASCRRAILKKSQKWKQNANAPVDVHWFLHNNNDRRWINARGSWKICKLLSILPTNNQGWLNHSCFDIKLILKHTTPGAIWLSKGYCDITIKNSWGVLIITKLMQYMLEIVIPRAHSFFMGHRIVRHRETRHHLFNWKSFLRNTS